jgi:hypothetical protein
VACLDSKYKVVVTAYHCLPHLPPAPPWLYTEEERTYPKLLAPLGKKPRVWAECLFADPIADIAVLGAPDNQALTDEAKSYDALVDVEPLPVGEVPSSGRKPLKTLSLAGKLHLIEYGVQGKDVPAWLLSLKGRRKKVSVSRSANGAWLAVMTPLAIEPGMSGSPIASAVGEAIGLCSTSP